MFDQKEKGRYKLLVYNDFLSFTVTWIGFEPMTLSLEG